MSPHLGIVSLVCYHYTTMPSQRCCNQRCNCTSRHCNKCCNGCLHRPTPMLQPQPRMDMQTDITLVTALQSQLGRGQAPGNLPVYITFKEMTRHLYHCWYRSHHGGVPLICQHPSIRLSYTLRHYCMMQYDTKAKKVSALVGI